MLGESFTVTVTGTNTTFMQGTTTCVQFSQGNTTIELSDVAVDSETELSGTLTTGVNAPEGAYNVKVFVGPNCDGTEWDCEDCFTIVDCNLSAAAQATDITCNGESDGSATVETTGGMDPVTISWSNNMMGTTITNLAAGTYQYTVEDAGGCQQTGSATVNEPPPLEASIASTTDVSCHGGQDGSIDLDATGGTGALTFMWDNGAGDVEDPEDLSSGTYTVEVADANGCSTDAEATIQEPDSISLTVSGTDETSMNASDGTAAVAASGGILPYGYLWNTGDNTDALSDLAAGIYTVTVTDDNGCIKIDSVMVNAFNCALSATTMVADVDCHGDSTGNLVIEVSGATEPVSFSWAGGDFGGMLDDLPAGAVSVTITDGANCSIITADTIREPVPLEIVIDSTKGDEGSMNGLILSTVTGGTGLLTFAWTSGGNVVGVEEDLTGVPAGTYVLGVTDANGCMATSDSVVIDMVTSTLEDAFGGEVQLFPNPTQGSIYLQSSLDDQDIDARVRLYDLSGKMIGGVELQDNRLDLNHLTRGIYLAEFSINQRPYYTKIIRL